MSNQNETYSFADWDAERFQRARDILGSLAIKDAAPRDARSAILALYFQDNPELGVQDV